MLKNWIPKLFIGSGKQHSEIIKNLNERNDASKKFQTSLMAYRLANNLKKLDFSDKPDSFGFVKYLGLKVKNHTTIDLHDKGMTILEVKSGDEDIVFNSHLHDDQDQHIRVISGKIADLENNMLFSANESYYIPKRHKHLIKYFKNTNAMVIYMPNLKLAK